MNIQKHGGQDNNINIEFKEDFSVTTNFLGPNKNGLKRISQHLSEIVHYPPQDFEPYLSELKNFIFGKHIKNNNILMGNGASELIDLVIRTIPDGSWKPGPSDVQFLEYERSSINTGREKKIYNDRDTKLTCIINPTNPTGDFMDIGDLKDHIIKNCRKDSYVLVDESMQPWYGSDWRDHSLISQTKWISNLAINNNIFVYIIHSWTKIFSCTGIRLGSIICPIADLYNKMRILQVPWSVNILGLHYLDACIKDTEYLRKTWDETTGLRKMHVDTLKNMFPSWTFHGEPFLSWIWINTWNPKIAELAYNLAKFNGTPIRYGKMGYKKDTFIRIAVRSTHNFNSLVNALRALTEITSVKNQYSPIHVKISPTIIDKFEWVEINTIKPHEKYIEERHNALLKYIKSVDNVVSMPALILDNKTLTIIDGHHRHSVMKALGINKVPAILINYDHSNILVNVNNNITKEDVRQTAVNGKFLEPKSTIHMIIDNNGAYHPIQVISPIVFINTRS